jgi:hypothetical protein
MGMSDPRTKVTLDAVIERLEVLDGVRGDDLDKAVTFRDLEDSGFVLGAGGTGQSTIIVEVPANPGGPAIGPADPPANLTVAETFLALQIAWDNPSFNLQHIEVWRATTDNLSLAVKIGTTVAPFYMDYVGANATYYYWARSVGTDGTFSAYNAIAGTQGTTGIDPSSITMDPDNFKLQDGVDIIAPFLVGEINGVPAVGLQGLLLVDGSIRSNAIFADQIGANHIDVVSLSAIQANMGTLRTGRITTGTDGTAPDYTDQLSFRVELQDQFATAYPIWYGSGAKSAATGKFYVDANGNVIVNGLLDAGMIKQSYFAPAGDNDSFRVATEYDPLDQSTYMSGVYSGKKAHLLPMKTSNFQSYEHRGERIAPKNLYGGYLNGPTITFTGPFKSTSTEYGRVGTYSEIFMINFSASAERFNSGNPTSVTLAFATLQYQYDAEGWFSAFQGAIPPDGAFSGHQVFVSRSEPWDDLSFRVHVEVSSSEINKNWGVHNISLGAWTPNFGYGDANLILQPPDDDTPVNDLPDYPQYPGYITP